MAASPSSAWKFRGPLRSGKPQGLLLVASLFEIRCLSSAPMSLKDAALSTLGSFAVNDLSLRGSAFSKTIRTMFDPSRFSSSSFRLSARTVALTCVLAGSIPLRAAEIQSLAPKTGLPAFEYTESPEALPNYVAGAKWGVQTTPIRTMQKPVTAEESLRHLVMPPGFEAQLFAAEPEITKPICMAWDEKGRLWIAETVDYPNDMQPPGQGRDRIKICEDTNGDGKADKFTIFADKLSIPTSLVFARGGVIIAQAPDFLFLADTNGDDKADVREVLFTGWGTTDTHAGPSNLHWGFDNWIWGTVGYSGFEGTVGGKKLKFGMGVYRFRPDGSALEFIRSSNNNTWGLGLSEDGEVFGSTANGNASMYVSIPNRFYEQVEGWAASRLETIADSQSFYPITKKVRQVDWHDRYTAGAGHSLYTARSFPKSYWNRTAFVCEPTGHLIGFFDIEAQGADYVAHNRGSFLGSDDEWTAPISAEVGPDGALWMIDWYNYIVQHNPVPNGFKNGRGNAYQTGLRDKRHGRVYRLVHTASKPSAKPALDSNRPETLVAALRSDNLLWRMHAQRLLVARGKRDVVPPLRALVEAGGRDDLDLNPGALHALWTLHGLEAPELGAIATHALAHAAPSVRRAAIAVLPRTAESTAALLQRDILFDSTPQVRLAALLAIAEMPTTPEAGALVQAALQTQKNSEDRWIRHAAISAGARHIEGFMKASVAKAAMAIPPGSAEALSLLTTHYAHRADADSLLQVLFGLRGASSTVAPAILQALSAQWPSERNPSLKADERARLVALIESLDPQSAAMLAVLAHRWGDADLFKAQRGPIVNRLRADVASAAAVESARIQASQNLLRLSDNAESIQWVLEQISVQSAPTLNTALINALSESRLPLVADAVAKAWKRFTPVSRRAGLALLMRRPEWTDSLVTSLEANIIPSNDLGPEHWQQLRGAARVETRDRIAKLQTGSKSVSTDRESVVKKLLPVANQKGDAQRGKEVFAASCGVCHAVAGVGGRVGPDLTGIGVRPRAEILTEILDPNRSVEANYRMWTATTKDGESLSGRLDAETQTSVEILDVAGQKHIVQRKDLQSLDASTLSIMPVGFEALPESDLASLLEFLAQAH